MARTQLRSINTNTIVSREAFASRKQSSGDILCINYDVETGRIYGAFIDRWIKGRHIRIEGRVSGNQFIYSANGYDELALSVVLP